MNIVMTGATSFIVAPFLRKLSQNGHQVYALARPGSNNLARISAGLPGIHPVLLGMDGIDRLPEEVPGFCDVFFHFAWEGSGSDNRRKEDVQFSNVPASLRALEAAADLGCTRFVFAGSQAEYGIHHELMHEGIECHPDSPYGMAKLEFGEQGRELASSLGIDFVHMRIFSVYGPGMHGFALVPSCIKAFAAGEPLELSSCTQMWNYLYTEDLAGALWGLAFHRGSLASGDRDSQGGIYNIAANAGETRPLSAYVEDINEACGGKGIPVYGKLPPNAEGLVSLSPDVSKIKRLIGWTSKVPFREGILSMVPPACTGDR